MFTETILIAGVDVHQGRNVTLYPFNPRLVASFKKALGEEEKTDLRDVGLIAERLRCGKKLPRPFDLVNVLRTGVLSLACFSVKFMRFCLLTFHRIA